MVRTTRHAEVIAQLADGIAGLTTSDEWRRYLGYLSRFHCYSFNNVLLIAAQCPEATQVAGYRSWRKLNRHVRAGEKAIWILAPIRYRREDSVGDTERVVRGFKLVPVFDVSQTEASDCRRCAAASWATIRPAAMTGSSVSPDRSISWSRITSSPGISTATVPTPIAVSGSKRGTPRPSA